MTNLLLLFLQIGAGANPINPNSHIAPATGAPNIGAGADLSGAASNYILPTILGIAALLYIFMPIWAGATQRSIRRSDVVVYGVEELDLDHDLGKIDEDEWQARRPALLAQAQPAPQRVSVETLIRGFRRARRAELAIESEVLVARARKKNPNSNEGLPFSSPD